MVLQGGDGVGVEIERDLFQLLKGFNSQLWNVCPSGILPQLLASAAIFITQVGAQTPKQF